MYINEATFRQWWDIFHSEYPLCEIRLLGKNGNYKKTASGYFTDPEKALAAIRAYPNEMGVYAPINLIDEGCHSRYQCDRIVESPNETTSDNDIRGRLWLFIDFDPKRSSGTNATDEEKKYAYNLMRKVGIFLRDQGFPSPVIVDSANGYHLYYKVEMKQDADNAQLIKDFLGVLDAYFSDEHVEVDTSVFNAARISKVIGTKSNKGYDTFDRPKRESRFIQVPDVIEKTDKAFIQKVAAMMPKEEKPSRFNGYSSERFDLDDFIQRHGIEVTKKTSFGGGTKYVLAECPFDGNHKAPDSAIFLMNSGAIGFRCLHNSCSQYTWKDVRLKFEPNAYNRRDYEEFLTKVSYNSSAQKEAPTITPETKDKGKKWLSMTDIEKQDPSAMTYIPTGIEMIDYKMGGFCLGDVTVVTGRPGSGKTTILNMVTLNAIHRGYKVAVWSGELQPARFQSWIDQTAAGKNHVRLKSGYDDWYYCPHETADRINRWLDGKLWLRNNAYLNSWKDLFNDIHECVETNGTQLIILDNLASLNIDSYAGERNDRQSKFISDVKNFAKEANIHVIVVIHPRKEMGLQLLRMESLSGSSDLFNLADNVMLLHRVGNDFERRASQFFSKETMMDVSRYDEVIEVTKNRSHGLTDYLVGQYYEKKSRRFTNTLDEHVVFGWQEDDYPSPPPVIPLPMQETTPVDDGLPFEQSNTNETIPF